MSSRFEVIRVRSIDNDPKHSQLAIADSLNYSQFGFHGLSNRTPFGSADFGQIAMNELQSLFDAMYRENHQMWVCLLELHADQLKIYMEIMNGSIHSLLVQMICNENLWVNYLWHDQVEYLRLSEFPTLAKIRHEWDSLEAEMRDYLSILTVDDLGRVVDTCSLNLPSVTLIEILTQVVNYAASCRTQILAGIHELCDHVMP